MTQFYRHSGIVPLGGVVRTAILGFGVATFVAIIYAFAVHYIPFVYLNVMMTAGFGIAIGAVVLREAQATNIRNSLVPAAIGFCCGLAGLYMAWAADLVARLGPPPGRSYFAGLDPSTLLAYVNWFYENGQWGVGRGNNVVSGIPLALVWLTEAGMILGLAAYWPWNGYQENVFCETCQAWAPKESAIAVLEDRGDDGIVQQIHARDFAKLRDMPLAAADSARFMRLNLACCSSCAETNALDVERITVTVNKKGERSEKKKTLVNRLLLSADDVEVVRSAGRPVETPAESATSQEHTEPPEVAEQA